MKPLNGLPKFVNRRRQRGIALATVIFLMLILALLAGAILYAAQLDTISSYNYGASTRAGYIADAGLQQALNWFQYQYCDSNNTNGTCPYKEAISSYTTTTTPVEYGGQPVVLDASGSTSNYPNADAISSFQSALQNASIANGQGSITAVATLISDTSVHTINGYQSLERWELQVTGYWSQNGVNLAHTQVVGFVEEAITPISNYAMFTTGKTCGSITMQGGAYTDSYDSSLGYSTSASSSGGDVGSYGNIQASGGATIGGNAYVPGGITGSCSAGSPVGFTQSGGNVTVNGSIKSMTADLSFPTPTMAYDCTASTNCLSVPSADSGGNITLTPNCTQTSTSSSCTSDGYSNLQLTAGQTVVLPGGTSGVTNVYYINSIVSSGQANVLISPAGSVQLYLVGDGISAGSYVVYLDGGSITNTLAPSDLQIYYAGQGSIDLTGGSQSSFLLYAPNASAKLEGSTNFYGSIIANAITETGSAAVHYDRQLRNTTMVLDPFLLVSWNRMVQ